MEFSLNYFSMSTATEFSSTVWNIGENKLLWATFHITFGPLNMFLLMLFKYVFDHFKKCYLSNKIDVYNLNSMLALHGKWPGTSSSKTLTRQQECFIPLKKLVGGNNYRNQKGAIWGDDSNFFWQQESIIILLTTCFHTYWAHLPCLF